MAERIHSKGTFRHEEMRANETGIYPGMLLVVDSSGEVGRHTVEGGELGDECLIAEEDALQGNTVDTVYADDAVVSVIIPNRGSVVRMRLAENEVVSIGEKVVSSGDGYIAALDNISSPSQAEVILGVADEALDLSSGSVLGGLVAIRVS